MRIRKGPPGVSIYKPAARSKPRHSWLIHYKRGGEDVVETVSPDWGATFRYAVKISERLERERLGLLTGRERSAMEHASTPLLPRLDERGEPAAEADGKVRPNHLDDFLEILRARGDTPRWVQMLGSRCRAVIEKAEFEVIGDVVADRVELALGALADEEEHSDQTSHHYCKAMKQLTRWLRKSGRAMVDELEDLKPPSVLHVVHTRRAMEEREIAALVRAAQDGVDYRIGTHAICGADRALLYRLAVETGLRANELRQLTPESFLDLPGDTPMVRVKAVARIVEGGKTKSVRQSKNRKDADLYLRRDTARAIARFVKGMTPGRRIWWVPDKPVLMMDVDRAAAGLVRETLYGILDFHSLRHTFCTRVGSDSRNSLKTCQELMRHSDPRLTARYMHTTVLNQVAAVEGMPSLSPRPQRQRATGTAGAAPPAGREQRPVQRREFPAGPGGSLPFPGVDDEPPDASPASPDQPTSCIDPKPDSNFGLRNRRLQVRALQGAVPEVQQGEELAAQDAAPPRHAPTYPSAPGAAPAGSAPATPSTGRVASEEPSPEGNRATAQPAPDPLSHDPGPAGPPAPSGDVAGTSPDRPAPSSIPSLEQLYLWLGQHLSNQQQPKGGSR